jgi:glycosyltransferase involved in cell wall biosynthesis
MNKPDNYASWEPAVPNEEPVLVSVVIPAYQSANYIGQALDSVFAQTFSNYEVIVVNDGSPDAELLERALQPYKARVRYIKQENRGPSGARNAGVLQARGKYVAFLDSDDFWFPDHLANQTASLLKNPSLGLVYADSILIEDDVPVGHAFGQQPQAPRVTFEALVVEACSVGTSSTVASRQALIDAGLFDERFKRCEDFDLWLRMAFRGTRMGYEPRVHACHRLFNGLSSDHDRMKEARIEVYEKIASMLPISVAQNAVIRKRIERIQAERHMERAKEFLVAEEYADALDAAKRACAALDNWKLHLAIFGLHAVPHLFRDLYLVYGQILRLREHRRRARFASKVKLLMGLPPRSLRS